ncbi:MAG: teichoic acid transporter [Frankiales bacterium]|nr:teichoic acid transporter [Frankiales bacterium]
MSRPTEPEVMASTGQLPAEPSDLAPAPESPPTEGLGRTASRGAGVTLAGQGLRILLQFASVTVLARLLSPRDYGLMAVGLVMVGIGEVVRDMGLSTAAVRSPGLTSAQRDGLFWLNAAAGALLTCIAVLAAEPLAAAFSQPALVPVVRVLAFTFLLNGLTAQYRAGLSRDLRFGALAVTEVSVQLVALVIAVTAAALGAGYWALVAQQLAQGVVTLLAVVLLARWLPGRPRRDAGLRPLLRFGAGMTGTQVVYYLGNNLDTLSLGLWGGPAALGLYNRGFQLLMSPLNQIRSPATGVAVPVLARIQHDLVRSGEYLKRSQLALGFSLVPALAVAAGTATPVVHLVLGSRWAAVAPVLTLLAVAAGAQTLAYVGSWVYLSRGLSGALLRYTLVSLGLSAVCIGAGSQFGVVGVAAGYASAALLEWPLSLWWLSRVTTIPVRALLLGALRILSCAAAAGTAAHAASALTASWPSLGRIAAGAAAALSVYAVATLVPRIRRDVLGVVAWGRQMVGR